MLIYHQESLLVPWAADKIGIGQFRDDAKAIGIMSGDKIRGVAVFDTFSECDCNIHVASDGSARWLTREFLVHVFALPFIQCGLRRVTGIVPASNERALRFDLKLGFTHEGYCPKALPNDDVVILGMIRSACRFIPPQYRVD